VEVTPVTPKININPGSLNKSKTGVWLSGKGKTSQTQQHQIEDLI